jgi:hypothetical protein
MNKLLTSIIVFAGITLMPQLAFASSIGFNDIAYGAFAYGAPYAQNVAATSQYMKNLNNGVYGGYGYTPAGYSNYNNSYYSPYYMSGNYTPLQTFGNGYGYGNGYNNYGGYNGYTPNYSTYMYSPYQSLLSSATNMSYMSLRLNVPYNNTATQYTNPVDVAGLQTQSTMNSPLNQYGYTNWSSKSYTPTQTQPMSIDGYYPKSTVPTNSGFSIDGDYGQPSVPSPMEIDGSYQPFEVDGF